MWQLQGKENEQCDQVKTGIIIQCIGKNANGYTNWTRFRNRVLYVLDKNSSYSMYPMKKKEEAMIADEAIRLVEFIRE